MGRPSNRAERRAQILRAFARVMARSGYAGATIAQVAREAGLAPGLLHHHFASKEEMLAALHADLMQRFHRRVERFDDRDPVAAYVDAALSLDGDPDLVAARCWVGLFAEALRRPTLFRAVRRTLDSQVDALIARSGHKWTPEQATRTLAFIVGALVVGAFLPDRAPGFARGGLLGRR